MICKKCGQELTEVGAFCPFCGEPKPVEEETVSPAVEETVEEIAEQFDVEEIAEESAEEIEEGTGEEIEQEIEGEPKEETEEETAPARKLKLWQLIAIIAGGIVLLAVLVGAVLYAMGVELKDLLPRENDILYKDSYTVSDEVIEKKADDVIAKIGDEELTVAELQLYYTNDIYTFLSQYYDYLAYFGLNTAMPLDEQPNPMAEGQTWQQYFLQTALTSWQSYTILEILMEQEGYVPSEAMQAQLDTMEQTITAMAESYGYEDAQTYLDEQMTPGITLDVYMDFNTAYYTGNEYLDQQYTKMYPTTEEIDAYYQENLQTFTDNGVEPGMGLQSSVRHILIKPEGGTTAEDGTVTYSDEEKAAAYAEAERILEEWKTGDATEESFAQLANTYSKDGGSNTTGGLYQNINIDASYVEEFRAWAVDAGRQVGDTAIVETQFGYHIMYFVSGEDYFTYTVGQQLVAQRVQDMLMAAQEAYPMEVNYKKIALYAPNFG